MPMVGTRKRTVIACANSAGTSSSTIAKALESAGAFSLVLECVPADLASRVTASLAIPTIGIGAGAGCDAQVLVWQDLMGLTPAPGPRFVKRYADLRGLLTSAAQSFAEEVRDGVYPGPEHAYE